ncbi:MAG: hypothetical protein GXY82_07125 [Methanospirillum sp.]|nr:hypothetical protein [Methanospirillum sp.]
MAGPPESRELPLEIVGPGDVRDCRGDATDDCTQPGNLSGVTSQAQQRALLKTTARTRGDAPMIIEPRQIENRAREVPAHGRGIAAA